MGINENVLSDSIAIIAPRSNTANNIYSLSEMTYMQKYLISVGYQIELNSILSASELRENAQLIENRMVVLVLQFESKELFPWLESYKDLNPKLTILYGISAITFGDHIRLEYGIGDSIIRSFRYSAVADALSGRNPSYENYDICELSEPYFDMPELLSSPFVPIISSRGCPNACHFCAFSCGDPCFRQYVMKPNECLVEEILTYVKKYKKSAFYFVDSCFITNTAESKHRAQCFAKKIIDLGIKISFYIECRVDSIDFDTLYLLKAAGLKRVLLGVESFIPNVLKKYNKQIDNQQTIKAIQILDNLGINVDITLITIEPDTTRSDLINNIKFILDHNLSKHISANQVFRRLIVLPNNRLKFSAFNYDQQVSMPIWYSKCCNYTLNNPDVLVFEEFIVTWLPKWQECARQNIMLEKNITKRLQLRYIYSEIFFKTIYALLNIEPFPTNLQDLVRIADERADYFIQCA